MEKNWKFHHVGVVVSDMEKAVEYYKSLGIATTIGPEGVADIRTYPDLKVYGKPADASFNVIERSVHIGSLQLDLIQTVEGESALKKFLESKGDGVHHIAFTVDDFDKEAAELVRKGFPVVLGGKASNGEAWAYFDTRKVGDVILELYRPPSK